MWRQNAIFGLAQIVPPIECDLGYRFPTRTLNPNPNPKTDPNHNPNPKPNPKSNKNLCSAKRHPNKVTKYKLFRRAGGGGVKGL